MKTPNVYTIPAGTPFARALAAKLLQQARQYPDALTRTKILLPTRRACTVLRDAFLRLNEGKPLLLPRLQPLGDIEEEEISLSLGAQQNEAGWSAIPPSMPPLQRQLLLTALIEQIPGYARGTGQALALAGALGRLMDQIYTEGLDIGNLPALVPAEFSEHWQITLKFLTILSQAWPAILKERGQIDAADRRNRLIRALADHWQAAPPPEAVIAAGSTGSIPATKRLLAVIAGLPKGSVILPGLDQDMDEKSWTALDETHPQYGLRDLLGHFEIDRKQVQPWLEDNTQNLSARRKLASETMRPAETVRDWAHLGVSAAKKAVYADTLKNLRLIEAAHEGEEAAIIAALFRETLESPGKTATLVTPDRLLARRVAACCRRWNIAVDDSAGQPLGQTGAGAFLRLCAQAMTSGFTPVNLLALLRHDRAACGMEKEDYRRVVETLEKKILRGPSPAPGLTGLRAKIMELGEADTPHLAVFLRVIEPWMQWVTSEQKSKKIFPFKELVMNHIRFAETVAAHPSGSRLWAGEDGEAASGFFAELLEYGESLPDLSPSMYREVFETLLQTMTVRKAYGAHPRLKILGQLEARLTEADLVIMGGLNEGTWPEDAGHDPWMSRPMRKQFGLPSAERATGLSAHDFVQGFCAPEVVLTRARRKDGAPAVPSRWLQRLLAVLEAANLQPPVESKTQAGLEALERVEKTMALSRPSPAPPVAARPRKMAATRIETWLRDPYSVYARYILGLKKLDPLEKPLGAAERGTLLHNILQQFVADHPDSLPADMAQKLEALARKELEKFNNDPAVWSFWWPRFRRIADWLETHEKKWRLHAKPLLLETKGTARLSGDFTLEATPDRIDSTPDGPAIIDYKSGGSFTKKGISDGDKPQLALEALILSKGGFPGIPPASPGLLAYWILKGGADPGDTVQELKNLETVIEKTQAGLETLVSVFDNDKTPYYSLPNPARAPDYNDYEHLARVKEWSVGNSDESEAT